MTTENVDNEKSDKGQLDIYIQFSFLAKTISNIQTHSGFLAKEEDATLMQFWYF